jgi:hypothetical protein
MVRYRVIAFVACVALASNAPAPTVGSLPPSGSSYISKNPSAAALLLVDPTHPVTEAGSLTTATLRWESAPAAGCASAYKLKFFRPSTSGGLTFVAERGPFNLPASAGLVTTALTPPVDVVAGDLLGVVQLQNSCGGVALGNADDDRVFYSADADPTSGTFTGSRLSRGFAIHARASSDPSVLEGYIPVVGATAGGFGSQFKTGLQISNIDADPISGKLVFHPAGASGAASDPAVTYSLSAYQTVSYDNIMETLGRTGLGSIDILSTSSSAPLITTRVFTDAGALGTSGFTEETQPPQAALGAAERASFTIPS